MLFTKSKLMSANGLGICESWPWDVWAYGMGGQGCRQAKRNEVERSANVRVKCWRSLGRLGKDLAWKNASFINLIDNSKSPHTCDTER